MAWLSGSPGDWRLEVWVQPGASRTGVQGIADDRLRVRLSAPPVEGRANVALLKYLAERLGVAPSRASVLRGDTGRRKTVRVQTDATQTEIERRLLEDAG